MKKYVLYFCGFLVGGVIMKPFTGFEWPTVTGIAVILMIGFIIGKMDKSDGRTETTNWEQ